MNEIKVATSTYGKGRWIQYDYIAHTDGGETDEYIKAFYANEQNEMGKLVKIETVDIETEDTETSIGGYSITCAAAYEVALENGLIESNSDLDTISGIYANYFTMHGDLYENACESLSDFGSAEFIRTYGFTARID